MSEVEILDGESRELVVADAPQGQALVASASDPAAMVAVAAKLAAVLTDIVERKKLYATIQGKRYPTVEAWMTIARLDNVVAREPRAPVRNEDGSYEAFAELVRLSDGVVIGSSSALCGTPDDAPWGGTPKTPWKDAQPPRSEPARRSMAQTRATSRAFRQQYSWIMALAGYEATPAEEMPHDAPRTAQEPTQPSGRANTRSFTGMAVTWNQQNRDGQVRMDPDDIAHYGFILECQDGKKRHVDIEGDAAIAVAMANPIGQVVTATGPYKVEDLPKKDGGTYKAGVIYAQSVTAPDGSPLAEKPDTELDAALKRAGGWFPPDEAVAGTPPPATDPRP